MFIPEARGILKQMSLPAPLVYGVVSAVLVLLVATIFLSTHWVNNEVAEAELERLKAENNELRQKFEDFRWTLAEVEDRYDELVDKEIMIRSIFDMEEINPEERQLGVGGPVPAAVLEMTPAQLEARSTEGALDRLLRLSEYELQNFTEVETELVDLKERLRHTPSIWPAKGWVTAGFHMRDDPFTGYRRMHAGLDIANRQGTHVIAPADGRVKSYKRKGGWGNLLVIDHGYGFETRYAHLKEAKVKRGQKVKRGDLIALVGNTGHSTGSHLHYEVLRNGKKLNPRKYILNDMYEKK